MTGDGPAPIVLHPDPVLSTPAAPALASPSRITTVLERLWTTCHSHGGAGLAAPQIGVSLRLAVVDGELVDFEEPEIILVDPEILETGAPVRGEEGCLSFPGLYATIRRPRSATVRTHDAEGRERILELEGLPARAVLHEIDHLDGILMPDRMGPLRRWIFLRRHALRRRRHGRGRPAARSTGAGSRTLP